jgi:HD-like signal output (HDOD) protein
VADEDSAMREEVQAGIQGNRASTSVLPWKEQPARASQCRYFPPFPALPTTLVELELLLAGHTVNLQKVVSVVRKDPGFAAEVIRLARKYEDQRPLSLETCLIHLGMQTIRRAMRIVPPWVQLLSEAQIWKLRSRLRTTRFVALAAEAMSAYLGDIPSETAYMAGLLHDLPALVCTNDGCKCSLVEFVPSLQSWNLPDYLVETIRWYRQPMQASPEHFPIARRVAAARAWVSEVQLSSDVPAENWAHTVSQKTTWQRMPNQNDVLRLLADKLEEWQFSYSV